MLRTRPWLLFLVALVIAGACRCDEPGVGGARGDFRPRETEVDFGRALEGEQSRRTVTLQRAPTSRRSHRSGLRRMGSLSGSCGRIFR